MLAVPHEAQGCYSELGLTWTGRGAGRWGWLRIGQLLVGVWRRAIAPAAGRRSRIGCAVTLFIVRRRAVPGIGGGCSTVVLGFVRSVAPTGRAPGARSAGRRGWSGWIAGRTRFTVRTAVVPALGGIAVRNSRHSDASGERLLFTKNLYLAAEIRSPKVLSAAVFAAHNGTHLVQPFGK